MYAVLVRVSVHWLVWTADSGKQMYRHRHEAEAMMKFVKEKFHRGETAGFTEIKIANLLD